MNWGQTGYSLHDLHVESCRTSFGAPLLDMMNHLELLPPHLRCDQVLACPRTDIQDDIHRERCEYDAMQCNVDKQQRSNTCYASRSTKHQYEHDLTHKMVMGDTFTLQELVQVSNELEFSQT